MWRRLRLRLTTLARGTLTDPAPALEAMTTHGVRKLGDYQAKWLVLFSHPADFKPVCNTEFVAFAKACPAFQKVRGELLGLSIDSGHARIAWVRNIKEKFGVEIPFPIIEDLSMRVATPEDWQPGDKVIVPPPATVEAAEKRMGEGYGCTDWYFCKKVA